MTHWGPVQTFLSLPLPHTLPSSVSSEWGLQGSGSRGACWSSVASVDSSYWMCWKVGKPDYCCDWAEQNSQSPLPNVSSSQGPTLPSGTLVVYWTHPANLLLWAASWLLNFSILGFLEIKVPVIFPFVVICVDSNSTHRCRAQPWVLRVFYSTYTR